MEIELENKGEKVETKRKEKTKEEKKEETKEKEADAVPGGWER